jgi:F0F1-type ATP synthase membrane subunit a
MTMVGPILLASDILPPAPVEVAPAPFLTFDYATVFNCFLIVMLLSVLVWRMKGRLAEVPGRGQAALEAFVGFFRELVHSTMGSKLGRTYVPLIGTIFLYVWISNIIGLLPKFGPYIPENPVLFGDFPFGWWRLAGFTFPAIEEPSKNVNFPWSLGIMVFLIMHVTAVRHKGVSSYSHEYFSPFLGSFKVDGRKAAGRLLRAVFLGVESALIGAIVGLMVGVPFARWLLHIWLGVTGLFFVWGLIDGHRRCPAEAGVPVGIPNILMFPLNVIGKFAEIVSMSFRLFGNIFGGAVIAIIVTGLLSHVVIDIGLGLFFGLFVGTIQAFVFTMLSVTYITIELAEE